MIQKSQTIVTESELQREDDISPVDYSYTEQPHRDEKTPGLEGGYPVENYPKASNDDLQEIGKAEATKTSAQSSQLNTNKFDTLIKNNSAKPLYTIKTARILDFFPSEVSIERTKVNVSLRDYFFARRLHTIDIKDIEDVFIQTTPFYATLQIVDKGFVENSVQIQFLRKHDAKKARRIIQGLMSAKKEGIDILSLPQEGLLEKLETLGNAGEVESIGS